MKYGTTVNWHRGAAAGCSQRVSLPVVFRLNRRLLHPFRHFFLSHWGEGGEINRSPPTPSHAHGIKVATGPADRSFDLRQNMQLNDDNMSVGVGGGGKVSICHELLSQNFVTDD